MGISMLWYPVLPAVVAAVLAFYLGSWVLSTRRPRDFPPGPPPALVVGNALQLPSEKTFLKFHEWSKTYGDMVGIKIGADNYVILSSAEHGRELYEKRGAIYSDRKRPYVTSQIVLPGTILFMKNDRILKKTRTALGRHLFGPAELRRAMAVQTAHSAVLMRRIAQDPERLREHLRHWALATPLSILSGQAVSESGVLSTDDYFRVQDTWLRFLKPAQAPPVDLFPVMRYVPDFLAGWKREAYDLHRALKENRHHMLDGARAQHARITRGLGGAENESTMTKVIVEGEGSKGNKGHKFEDHELALFGAGVLDAAVDTLIATASSMVLTLGAYPDVQKRIQAEVDSIWRDDVPGPEDLHKAVYLRACLTEAMRWRPSVPTGLPRVLARDDTYRGFRFPKGTTFLLHTWSIHMDEAWYDAPGEFRPERYLDNAWGVRPSMREAAERQNRHPTYNFGIGRRACPGLVYAENQALVTIAKLAWGFDVVPRGTLDTSVETGFHDGLVLGVAHVDVDLPPRSEERKGKMLEDSARAETVVSAWVG
ncbi:Ent-sandaracopimaradiene 3-hydroxylase [Colletotrichum tanaceti]|uniref:Ent-sandaracopimaradiene 3-hydroxylase n=1 Tax=Colletotrichum tanaceti TaxID=1306861 RepID=A0A4U6XDM6_9PEZI|nr:Ent-sandaracopimaradiene 3-hydroxylase [Colletotrichum tanaceti]TKW53242.1 Ent-sandaracopimaradiene 3-hydroxylase [Colletotrichum tanaceti]